MLSFRTPLTCKQLLDDPKETRGHNKFKEWPLERNVRRTRSGRAYGPVVRQRNESTVSSILIVTWHSRYRSAQWVFPKSASHSSFCRLLHILRCNHNCPISCSSLSAKDSGDCTPPLSTSAFQVVELVGGSPHQMTFRPNDQLVLWCGLHEVETTRVQ